MTNCNSGDITNTEFKIPPQANLCWGVISQWLAMGVSIVLGLIVTRVIIRTLGNESYGLWGLIANFVGFYRLFDFGLRSAVSRFLGNAIGAKDIGQFNQVASTGKCLLCAASLLIIIFALLIIEPAQSILRIPEQYSEQFRLLVILWAVSMAISMVMSIYGGALHASEDFVFLSYINIGGSIIRSSGGLAIVLAGKGVVGLAAVNVVTTALEQFVIFLRCRIRLPQMKASFCGFETGVARSLIGFGAASFVVTVAAIVRSKLDVMMVTRFGGLGQAGLYAVALTVFRYSCTAILTVAGMTWPRLNNLQGTGNHAELQAFFLRASHVTVACASLLTGLLIGLASLLFHLWVGDGYGESATVLRILIAGYFLDFATNPGIGSLYATARHRYFAVQTTVEAAASFTLAYLLGVKFGMKGVALGMVIPITVVKLTIQPWYVTRNLSIRLGGYWLRVIGMATLATATLAGAFVLLEYSLTRWSWWTAPPIIAPALVVTGVILWQMVLDKADRAHIISLIKQAANRLVWLRDRISVPLGTPPESKDAM